MGKASKLGQPRSFKELQAAEEHLRLAQEAGGIGTWEWDLTTRRMRGSAQMFRNLGLEPRHGDDLYEALLTVAHPADRRQIETALEGFRRCLGPIRIELRAVWPGNDIHWIVLLGKVEADAVGRPARMRGISIDGTRRRRGEEAAHDLAVQRARELDARRAQMQAFFDNSPDWLTLFRATQDGRFVYEDLNRATERAYGLSRDRVVGRKVEEILGIEAAQLPLGHMRACLETGENQRYTARRTMAGQTRTIDVMFVRVQEGVGGEYFIIGTARDVTDREAIEEQLRQAQKMEVVGQLTGGVAHDFNNLLTAIVGNLELLAPRVAADPRAAKYVAAAQRAADSGAKLTEQLLAFSRRQHLQPQAVDLNTVIGGMGDLLSRTIGSTVQVHTALTPYLWPALVDPTQTEIAILNLAINARDATPLGGTLTIESRNLEAGSAALPRELHDRDCICISVRDTGTGMTEDVLRSAVEPFFTTKEVGKGSGLGLSQVYGLTQQSSGHLHLESRVGVGTSVNLFLPRAAGQAEGLDRQPGSLPEDPGGRILVVDDDAAVREITVQMLRQSGYGVAEVESGQAALDALARGEVYHLIVIDIAMPGLNGIDTVKRARERWPGLNVLFMTGFADIAGAGWRTADDPLIRKPFKLADLTGAVRNAIERGPRDRPATIIRLPDRS